MQAVVPIFVSSLQLVLACTLEFQQVVSLDWLLTRPPFDQLSPSPIRSPDSRSKDPKINELVNTQTMLTAWLSSS